MYVYKTHIHMYHPSGKTLSNIPVTQYTCYMYVYKTHIHMYHPSSKTLSNIKYSIYMYVYTVQVQFDSTSWVLLCWLRAP